MDGYYVNTHDRSGSGGVGAGAGTGRHSVCLLRCAVASFLESLRALVIQFASWWWVLRELVTGTDCGGIYLCICLRHISSVVLGPTHA